MLKVRIKLELKMGYVKKPDKDEWRCVIKADSLVDNGQPTLPGYALWAMHGLPGSRVGYLH